MKLEPVFNFLSEESRILLYKGSAQINVRSNSYFGDGEVLLELLPTASIFVYGYFREVPSVDGLGVITGHNSVAEFSLNGCKVDGFRISGGGDATKKECNIKWCPKSHPVGCIGDDTTQIAHVVFHLFNFERIVTTRRSPEEQDGTQHSIHHLDLSGNGWEIELKSLAITDKNIKELKEQGGYRLTHVGSIKKTDGAVFSGADAKNALTALGLFLSFAKGAPCYPICPVGFDDSDARVWEEWSSPYEPWRYLLSWFDPHHQNQLTTLFPGFMAKWRDQDWHDALEESVYWYLYANDSSRAVMPGIILTQAAIERLSFEFVKKKRLIWEKSFKDLKASDRFRLLFSSLGIPLDIPQETPELRNLATCNQYKWLDIPHALTEIRNSLVHPEKAQQKQLMDVYYEAWNLGLWCLEMSILAICGYSGTYGNRLKPGRYIGTVEDVPWKN